MDITKRSHSNPCFWIALWNEEYWQKFANQGSTVEGAREQLLCVLNLRANKLLKDTAENVHVEKNVANAEITLESAKAFCKRWKPTEYERFCAEADNGDYPLYLDFEAILTGMEGLAAYRTLLKVAQTGRCETIEDKSYLACFIALQYLRSSAVLQTSIEIARSYERPQFEYYWWLHRMLGRGDLLLRMTSPMAFAQWHIYSSREPIFPLPDTPVLISRSLMVALTPYLLLEIVAAYAENNIDRVIHHASVHKSKIREYRRRAIKNTFKELICPTNQVGVECLETYEWRRRVDAASCAPNRQSFVVRNSTLQFDFLRSFLSPPATD